MDKLKELEGIENAIAKLPSLEIGKSNDEISKKFNKLINLSKDYKSKTFLMMVIGPTKSGKSTLVNLLARDIVSPTDVAECTIRPSIIFKQKDDTEDEIVVYKSTSDDKNKRVECLDLVIDQLKDSKREVDKDLVDDSEKHEKQELKDVITNQIFYNDNTVITAVPANAKEGILAESGKNDCSIYLVDMPGFDGAIVKSEFNEDYLYQAMTERVDLILFVQSSVSAILDSSTQYFRFLTKSCSQGVPVFLINNAYDAKSWRKDNSIDISSQEENAYISITNCGISFKDRKRNVRSINLGMAYDYYFKDRENIEIVYPYNRLKEEYENNFVKFENVLKEDILEHINEVRLDNCKKKIINAIDKLKEAVAQEIAERERKIKEKENLKERLETEKKLCMGKVSTQFPHSDEKNIITDITEKASERFKGPRKELENDEDMEPEEINKFFADAIKLYKEELETLINAKIDSAYNDLHTHIFNIEGIDKSNLTFEKIQKCGNKCENNNIELNPEFELLKKKGHDWGFIRWGTKYNKKTRLNKYDNKRDAYIHNNSYKEIESVIKKIITDFEEKIEKCFVGLTNSIITTEAENEKKKLEEFKSQLEKITIKK